MCDSECVKNRKRAIACVCMRFFLWENRKNMSLLISIVELFLLWWRGRALQKHWSGQPRAQEAALLNTSVRFVLRLLFSVFPLQTIFADQLIYLLNSPLCCFRPISTAIFPLNLSSAEEVCHDKDQKLRGRGGERGRSEGCRKTLRNKNNQNGEREESSALKRVDNKNNSTDMAKGPTS